MRSDIYESCFFLSNFHASRSSFSPYHASRIKPLPPSSNDRCFQTLYANNSSQPLGESVLPYRNAFASSHFSSIHAVPLALKYPDKEAETYRKTAGSSTLLPLVSVFHCSEEFQWCLTTALLKLTVVLVYV